MLSKIIKLEDIKNDYINRNVKGNMCMDEEDAMNIAFFMEFTIEAFKTMTDEVIRLKETIKSQSYQISDLRKRIKRLEQQDSYYPNEEEIKSIKVGGTD